MKKLLLSLLIVSSFSSNAQFWTQKATTFTTASRGVSGMSIVDANTVWIKAYDGTATASQTVKEYAKSTDGGNTWTSGTIALGTGTNGLGISSITATSGTTAWISAFPATGNLGGIWKTVNGGTTWTKQTTALFNNVPDSFANFVYFWDANNGIAQGDPQAGYFEIYTTTNGGTNWTRVPSANIPLPLAGEYGYSNNYDTFGTTIWFGTNKGRIYKSTNSGLNWTVTQSPVGDFGSAAESASYTFTDASKGLLLTNAGVLYKTTDGAATWVTQPYTGALYIGDIEYIPGTTRVIATSAGSNAGSSYSLDEGLTWTEADAGVQHTETKFLDVNTGYSGGFNTSATVGGIYKYTGTELKTNSFISNKFSTYPNPVNDLVTISNTESIIFTDVVITDLNGRTVKNIKVSNLTEVQINVSDLNAGVYFMNITSDAGKAVKKFIKN